MSALGDCTCPVCLGILVEPVVMPCKHAMCRECFSSCVERTSLACPVCRRRIASWARLSAKAGTLVDKKRWSQIKKRFKKELQEKEASPLSSSTAGPEPAPVQIAQPGEIYREYLAELTKLRAEQEEQRRLQEAESEALARRLQAEEDREPEQEEEREQEQVELVSRCPAAVATRRRSRAAAAAASVSNAPLQPAIVGFVRPERAKQPPPSKSGRAAAAPPAACPLGLSVREDRPGDVRRLAAAAAGSDAAAEAATGSWQSRLSVGPSTDLLLGVSHPFGDLSNTVAGRSVSVDSLGSELNVFKPIRSYPLTPPRDGKRLTGGGASATLAAPKAARRLLQHSSVGPARLGPAAECAVAADEEPTRGRSRDSSAKQWVSNSGGRNAKGSAAEAVQVATARGGRRQPRRSSASSSSSAAACLSDVRPPSLVDETALPLWRLAGASSNSSGPTPCPLLPSFDNGGGRGDDDEFAKLLQSMYDMELKYKLNGVRMPGSGLEYALRRQRRASSKLRQGDPSPPMLEAAAEPGADSPPPAKVARRGRPPKH